MRKTKQLVSVIIPAYNEAEVIGCVLDKAGGAYEILVVDDGSTDETAAIARKHGAKVISYRKNLGKGYALKRGISESRGNILVFLDGDGQHNPKDIPKLIAPILAGESDFVIGVRSWHGLSFRRITNKLSSMAVRTICGRRYSDVLCGFRAVRRSVFLNIPVFRQGFEAEVDLLIMASAKKVRISEMPITARMSKRPSRLGVPEGMRIVLYLCRRIILNRKGENAADNQQTECTF